MKTGKREQETEVKDNRIRYSGDIRAELNKLHLQRGEKVAFGRNLRCAFGVNSKDFRALWTEIEELTNKIEACERELDLSMRIERVCTIDTLLLSQLVGALDEIRSMPVFDAEAGVRMDQLNGQYEEAREAARIAVEAWQYAEGEEVDNG